MRLELARVDEDAAPAPRDGREQRRLSAARIADEQDERVGDDVFVRHAGKLHGGARSLDARPLCGGH